jgi:hypothetical protein
MRRHAGRQTDAPMHDLHTMAHVSNRDLPLDVFFNKLGMTETCRRLMEDPSLIAGIRIDALDSSETIQRPNPRNPLDFGASKDFPWLRSSLPRLMRRHNIACLFDTTLGRPGLAIAESRNGFSEESLWLS